MGGHVAGMAQTTNVYKVFVVEVVNYIKLAQQDRVTGCLNTVINFYIS